MSLRLQALRRKFSLLGKAEWWWVMDETQAQIALQLRRDHFVVLDGFLEDSAGRKLREDVRAVHNAGSLEKGVLGGGRSGASLSYVHERVRGDLVKWFSGREPCWKDPSTGTSRLQQYLTKIGTLIDELGANCEPTLRGVGHRSDAMVTCYPSGGARYTRHCDNHCNAGGAGVGKGDNCNGRRLTALLYLNYEWAKGAGMGGELRVFAPDGEKVRAELPPRGGRDVDALWISPCYMLCLAYASVFLRRIKR